MHGNRIALLLAAVAFAVVSASAATPSGTISRDSLVTSDIANRLSVGADVTYMERGFQGNGQTYEAEARTYGGYVGYDVMSWLTVFATMGATQLKDGDTYWSSGTKWSLGVAPNLWEGDLHRPSFLAGRLAISAMVEYSEHESSQGNATVDWTEFAGALLLRYEVFEDAPWSADSVTSLRLSAGPMLSRVNGHLGDGSGKVPFRGEDSVGWVASAEWFIAPNFSIGGTVETFDTTSVSGSIRLHF